MSPVPAVIGAPPPFAATRGWARLRAALRVLAAGLAADRDRWALWLPVAVGAGVLGYFALRVEPRPWIGPAAVAASASGLLSVRRSVAVQALAAAVLATALGFAAAQWQAARMPPMPVLPKRAVLLDGTVSAVDLLPDGGRRVLVAGTTVRAAPRRNGEQDSLSAPDTAGLAFRVRLRADDPAIVAAGNRIALRAMLRPPPAPDWPGGRDGQRDAFFSGIGGGGFALGPATVMPGAGNGGLRRLREAVAARMMAVLPGPRGAVAATLMTGLGTAIPHADRDAFAASGLAHILAVAGLHLGIVMGLALFAARWVLCRWEWGALRLPCRQIAAGIALLSGAGYMAMTGLHLPGLRALAMAAVAVLALLLGRRAVSLRGLALAAAGILLWQPAQLLDVAFQMSFSAVLALLAGYEALRPFSRRLHGTGSWRDRARLHLFQLFMTSLLAGAASLPFAAFHFNRMQFYFVLANLLAVPITAAVIMPAGILALVAMPLGLERGPLLLMGGGIDAVIALARGVAAFPAASLPVPATPAWGVLGGTLGLLWLCVWRRRWRLLGVPLILLGLSSPWLARPPDLLVSADAGEIAFRDGTRVFALHGARADPAAERDWMRDWGLAGAPEPFPDATVEPRLVCNPVACLLGAGGRVLLLRDPARPAGRDAAPAAGSASIEPGDCDGVALLVSPAPSRGACPGTSRIDRFTVWRDGPQAAWIGRDGGVRRWNARAARGARPWVPPDPAARPPSLPLAAAE
ncbi:MAG: ComEC/Rec2 family competence protein [Gluconacetobacter diazotrophicus]|nr:ComEC/Rec2 family competence protein [Gluconacetobacter diazotrophicus]